VLKEPVIEDAKTGKNNVRRCCDARVDL